MARWIPSRKTSADFVEVPWHFTYCSRSSSCQDFWQQQDQNLGIPTTYGLRGEGAMLSFVSHFLLSISSFNAKRMAVILGLWKRLIVVVRWAVVRTHFETAANLRENTVRPPSAPQATSSEAHHGQIQLANTTSSYSRNSLL